MDGPVVVSFIKILIFLPLVIILAVLSLKIGNKQMMRMGSNRLIRIVERVQVSGKAFLCIAVINDKPYVIGSTDDKIEILMELPEGALDKARPEGSNFDVKLLENFKKLLNRRG